MFRTFALLLALLLMLCSPLQLAAQMPAPPANRQSAVGIIPAEGPRLAGFAEGPWAGVNAVYQCPRFVATLGTNLVLAIQPIQDGTNIGRAVELRFGASYNDPRRAHLRHPMVARRVVSLKMPPPPTLRASKIRIEGQLEDNVDFDYQIAFAGNTATLQCKFKDPKNQAYPTSFAVSATVARSPVPATILKLEELEQLMPGWTLDLVLSDGKKLHSPYHRSIGLEAGTLGAREMTSFGPWGKRQVIVSSVGEDKKGARNSYFRHYPGYAPFNGYNLYWHLRNGDTKARGFTVEVQ